MEVDGRKIVIIAKDDQGKPDLAKSALAEAYEDDGADIAIGTTSSARGDRDAAGRRGAQEDPHRRAGGRRPDHRRQVEPLHLPHRAQFLAGRDLQRGRDRQARACTSRRSAQDYAFGRDGVAAFKQALAKTGATLDAEEYAPANTTDFTAVAQRLFDALKDKPGRKIIWIDLGRRRQSARQARRSRSRPLRHRAFDRRQHPARARRLQALPRPRGRGLLLLRHPQEPGQRLAGRRAPEALQRAAGLLHRGGFAAAMAVVDRGREGRNRPTRKS